MGGEFKWRHFAGEVILLCVRWYCRYGISYRDLEEMMGERGVAVDHTTLYRWVQRFAPELESNHPAKAAGIRAEPCLLRITVHGDRRPALYRTPIIV